ncbi:MAG: MFS transporter [Novosphingobium sp.]|uniref:MFS transporter n=1 Tax=Novosphingobium sp. TaxID=1874826 RepID=UPI0026077B11|nr:MFS transporter [Novosphingobium sp.]MCP5387283.1 MFS transporter [Novosphingobium sp.]
MDCAQPSSSPASIGEREFIAMMAMTMALQALCIDAMLPALGEIARDLKIADPNSRQLVIGVFLFAAAFGSLLPGALADRFGRRPVLMCAFAGYGILSIGCALATSFPMLLVLRALQALASAALATLPSAIIRDRFGGDRMARMMSTISVVFMFVPMIAPSYGQAVLLVAGWRWIFGGMAVMAAIVAAWVYSRLPETLDPRFRQPVAIGAIAANMAEAASNRAALGYVVGGAMLAGAMFTYLNSAQQLIAEQFGAGESFPLIFALLAAGLAVANFSNARIVERFGARRVSHAALIAYIVVSLVQVWQAFGGKEDLWHFIPLMGANICLMGFLGANFGSIALQPFARIAGAASSFQAFSRMVVGSLLGGLGGQVYDGTARPLALALLGCGLVSLAAVLYSEHGRLFRRLTPPGMARPVTGPELN